MPGIVVVELEPCCAYCRADDRGTEVCTQCKRPLCRPCRVGLGCLASPKRCSSKPNGEGVW